MRSPSSPPRTADTLRPAARVGLIAGLTLALAIIAQQLAISPEMRMLGVLIVTLGFSVTGYYAARHSRAHQRSVASGIGAVSGLIAGLCVSCAFIAASLVLSFDPQNLQVFQEEVVRQLPPAQLQQLQYASVDLKTLTQFSLVIAVTLCGLGFPIAGLVLGALGGASGVAVRSRGER